jgi:hypothetical protein
MNRRQRNIGKVAISGLVSLFIFSLVIWCFLPTQYLFAASTKTSTFNGVDAWQALAAGTLAVGNSGDVSDSYSAQVCVEVAYTSANAQAGITVSIETSYATGDDWMPLVEVTGQAVTPNLDDLDEGGGTLAGDTTITLTSSVGEYDAPGAPWFIIDTTVAESEVLRTKSENANVVTLVQDAKYAHADAEITTDAVDQWIFSIPLEAAFEHVIINNTDADAGIHWRSFILETEALN